MSSRIIQTRLSFICLLRQRYGTFCAQNWRQKGSITRLEWSHHVQTKNKEMNLSGGQLASMVRAVVVIVLIDLFDTGVRHLLQNLAALRFLEPTIVGKIGVDKVLQLKVVRL